MNIDQLNYAAFNEPITSADRQQFKPSQTAGDTVLKVLGFLFVGFMMFALFSISFALISSSNGFTVPSLIFNVLFYGAIGLAIWLYIRYKDVGLRLRKFAAQNNLRFIDKTYPTLDAGAIFQVGDSRGFVSGFESQDGKIAVANYQYTTGSGKNRHTVSWGVMRAKLSRHLPNVVLDSRANNVFGRMTNLPAGYSSGQKFELEGNFNQYFSVLAPDGYERDALYFLTPELMERLIQYGAAYDFEIIDDNLYIYKNGALKFNPQTLPDIFRTITYFGWQFEDNVKRYNDDRVAQAKVTNVVSADGTRLKRKVGWFGLVIFFVVIVVQILSFAGMFR